MSVAAGSWVRFGLIGLLALALGALLLFSAGPAGAQSGSGTVDYDTDGDNLIEVSTLAQLNAIRYDLVGNGTVNVGDQANYDIAFPNALASMGCAATCTGYELDADLDFNTDTGSDSGGAAVIDADDDYYNLGSGWEPLGDSGPNPFRTTFDGNNYTISNLFINRTGNSDNYIGLFGQLGGGSVRRVHLVGANVTGNNDVGALVGHITLGTVSHSSSSGTVSGVGRVGGLVGAINSTRGTVQYSRSSAVVTATGISVGGLVGPAAAVCGPVTPPALSLALVTSVGCRAILQPVSMPSMPRAPSLPQASAMLVLAAWLAGRKAVSTPAIPPAPSPPPQATQGDC